MADVVHIMNCFELLARLSQIVKELLSQAVFEQIIFALVRDTLGLAIYPCHELIKCDLLIDEFYQSSSILAKFHEEPESTFLKFQNLKLELVGEKVDDIVEGVFFFQNGNELKMAHRRLLFRAAMNQSSHNFIRSRNPVAFLTFCCIQLVELLLLFFLVFQLLSFILLLFHQFHRKLMRRLCQCPLPFLEHLIFVLLFSYSLLLFNR